MSTSRDKNLISDLKKSKRELLDEIETYLNNIDDKLIAYCESANGQNKFINQLNSLRAEEIEQIFGLLITLRIVGIIQNNALDDFYTFVNDVMSVPVMLDAIKVLDKHNILTAENYHILISLEDSFGRDYLIAVPDTLKELVKNAVQNEQITAENSEHYKDRIKKRDKLEKEQDSRRVPGQSPWRDILYPIFTKRSQTASHHQRITFFRSSAQLVCANDKRLIDRHYDMSLIPSHYICPLSNIVMQNPVKLSDGSVCDFSFIDALPFLRFPQKIFEPRPYRVNEKRELQKTNPYTMQPMTLSQISKDEQLKNEIDSYVEKVIALLDEIKLSLTQDELKIKHKEIHEIVVNEMENEKNNCSVIGKRSSPQGLRS